MGIYQYWCPKHHTTKRKTRLSRWINWGDGIIKADFKIVEPICQICRQRMVQAPEHVPKKRKKIRDKG